jgi:hypothetical protein
LIEFAVIIFFLGQKLLLEDDAVSAGERRQAKKDKKGGVRGGVKRDGKIDNKSHEVWIARKFYEALIDCAFSVFTIIDEAKQLQMEQKYFFG